MKRVAVVWLLAACTAPNPEYAGGPTVDASAGSEGGVVRDLAVAADLTPPPPVCTDGQRSCLAQSGSGVCQGGQYVLDRKCPADSTCAAGHCRAPQAGAATPPVGTSCETNGAASDAVCLTAIAGFDCQPFVGAGGRVTWACEKLVGSGTAGTACTDGAQCGSGLCGDNGTCFAACRVQSDCPSSGPQRLRCDPVQLTVEGVAVTASSCVP